MKDIEMLTALGHIMEDPSLPVDVAVEVAREFPLRDGELPRRIDVLRWAAIGLAVMNDMTLDRAVALYGE